MSRYREVNGAVEIGGAEGAGYGADTISVSRVSSPEAGGGTLLAITIGDYYEGDRILLDQEGADRLYAAIAMVR